MSPVTNAENAVCLARKFLDQPVPPTWDIVFKAKETKNYWLVFYRPKSGKVRGGASDLKVDKSTGQVTSIRGYR